MQTEDNELEDGLLSQDELLSDWEFYQAERFSQPATLLVHLGLLEEAPVEGLSRRVDVSIPLEITPDNFLAIEEDEKLEALEEWMYDYSESQEGMYVGRVTIATQRTYSYYVSEKFDVEAFVSALKQQFSAVSFQVQAEEDPEWSYYIDVLYPENLEFHILKNLYLVNILQESGDNVALERPVSHFVYFEDKTKLEEFKKQIESKGYRVTETEFIDPHAEEEHDCKEDHSPMWACIFEKNTSIEYPTICQVCAEIIELAETHEGEYDGWETEVMLPE